MSILNNQNKALVPQKTQPAAEPVKQSTAPTDAKIETAIKVFDWFSDPENYEVGLRNEPVFSVTKLCNALTEDRSLMEDALLLLEQQNVLGRLYTEPNIRGRRIRPINRSWLQNGGKQRLLAMLKPEAPKPHVPLGPHRVLKTTNAYVGSLFMTFKEGEVVRDEAQLQALLRAGAPIAKLGDLGARMCKRCHHRFDVSESKRIDHPIYEAVKRDCFGHGGSSVWLAPGDVITDRGRCLFMSQPAMKARLQHSVRALDPSEFLCCPQCQHVFREQLAKSA